MKNYLIKQITYKLAMDVVIKEHYLHRKAPCSIAFGLFLNDELKGVVCYGTPSSSSLRKGIAGIDNAHNVIELTRLWVNDDVKKNGESYLIGNTLKKCGKEIVVSYADTAQNHFGIVYQATNWLYTGLSAKRTNWTIEGVDKHCQTIADKYTAKEIRELYGDKFSLQPRSRKHRYVYINAKGKRKKELLTQLKYPIQNYPKKGKEND
jgi:hypothetical protein